MTAAALRIAPHITRTPVLPDPAAAAATGAAAVWIKAENLQRSGAFKARGAFAALTALDPPTRARGVVAFSSGNHGRAVATAARAFGIPATIVMPADAPQAKLAPTRALGAEIVLYDRARDDREAIAAHLAAEGARTLVPPFDHPHVIAGQGTIGLELAQDLETIDLCLACASGGGLAAGIALALRHLRPAAAIHPVEPQGHADIARSLAAGRPVANPPGLRSICDALLAPEIGALPFEIGRRLWSPPLAVTDEEVAAAMRHAATELHLVLEPSGAAALAALLADRIDARGRTVAVIASGGNVDPAAFSRWLHPAPAAPPPPGSPA